MPRGSIADQRSTTSRCRLPEMRGPVLARTLLQRFPNARVLYFTGQTDRLFEGRGVLDEREAFIDKPVTVNGLLEAVSMSLFGHTRGPARSHMPAVRCPHCQATQTVQTQQILTRVFYLCLGCGKSFERRAPTKAADA